MGGAAACNIEVCDFWSEVIGTQPAMRRILIVLALVGAALALLPDGARAQQRIGRAELVRNDVTRVERTRATPIGVGDDVVRNEVVRTGEDSDAKLVLLDDTNLAIGPNATLTLDRTVFSGETSYREVAIRLTAGAFRFITGHSRKEAYQIRTPLATLGVRGTRVDALIARGREVFVLQEGQARVCATSGVCAELLNPGDSVILTRVGNAVQIQRLSSPPWTFAAVCAGNPSLCSQSRYASLTPGDNSGIADALCGR